MPASSASRKAVSSLEPHHEVRIEYPCYDLLEDGEIMVLLQPSDMKSRYRPFPLVPDPSIEQSFPFKSLDDTIRASYYPAKRVFDPATSQVNEDTLDREDSLARDMTRATGFLGRTTLKVATTYPIAVLEDGLPKDECHTGVRICRETLFEREGGEVEEPPQYIYDSTVGGWCDVIRDSKASGATLQPWQRDVLNLIHQTMDYDVRHVQLQMDAAGQDYDEIIKSDMWKPPRQLPVPQGIAKIATIMTKPELDHFNETLAADDQLLQCPSCLEDFDESAANRPVLLPCSKKHCLCFTCTERWCKQNGLDQVTCPYCRQRLTPDHLLVSVQPNYLDIDSPFQYDRRFNLFENTERALAPLDRVRSWKDKTMIVVDHHILVDTWNMIMPFGWDDYTLCMMPLYAPEAWIFFKAFLDSVKQQDGKTVRAKDVYTALRREALRAFAMEFIANGMDKYICAERRAEIIKHPKFVPLRPGFRTFIRRTLNRVIQLPIQRACYDQDHRKNITEINPKGWHVHGILNFWCPEKGAIVPAPAEPEQEIET